MLHLGVEIVGVTTIFFLLRIRVFVTDSLNILKITNRPTLGL